MIRRRLELRHLVPALAVLALSAQAQEGNGGAIRSRIGFTQSWTDNLRLTEQDKDAALITTVSPGISITRNSGAIRGTLDYTLNGVTYLKTNSGSQVQNALTANGQAEIVPRTFYVDAQASIGQQNASAFGLQASPSLGAPGTGSALDNPNRRETGTLNVSPSLRGMLGNLASIDLRGNFNVTEVRGSALGDSRTSGATLSLAQLAPGTLSWYAQLRTQQSRPKEALSNRSSSVTAGLNYRPDPDWAFSAGAGKERSDYLDRTAGAQNGVTGNVTADWSPSPRTHLNANWQRHNYGNSHGLALDHRMRNSVWRVSDMRSVSLGNSGASGGIRTNYDLFFQLLASLEPDPVKRDQLVRTQLAGLGLSPDAPLTTGFLSSGPSQMRSQSIGFSLQGVRTNVTFNASRTLTSRLGSNANQGDLAKDANIEQRSFALSASYQLSPVSGLSLTGSRADTNGDLSGRRTRLTSLTVNWSARLGSSLSLQLGARHNQYEGVTAYSENGAYATLTQQF